MVWDHSGYFSARNRQKRAQELQRKRREARAHSFRFTRVSAEIQINEGELGGERQILPLRLFMNDLAESEMRCFSTEFINPGKTISITFENPVRFFVKAKVVGVREFPQETKIISEHPKYTYRIQLLLIAESAEEALLIKGFVKTFRKHYLLREPSPQAPQQTLLKEPVAEEPSEEASEEDQFFRAA